MGFFDFLSKNKGARCKKCGGSLKLDETTCNLCGNSVDSATTDVFKVSSSTKQKSSIHEPNEVITSNTANTTAPIVEDAFVRAIRQYRASVPDRYQKVRTFSSEIERDKLRNEKLSYISQDDHLTAIAEYTTVVSASILGKCDLSSDQLLLFIDSHFYLMKRHEPQDYIDFIKYAKAKNHAELKRYHLDLFGDFLKLSDSFNITKASALEIYNQLCS